MVEGVGFQAILVQWCPGTMRTLCAIPRPPRPYAEGEHAAQFGPTWFSRAEDSEGQIGGKSSGKSVAPQAVGFYTNLTALSLERCISQLMVL